VRPRGASSPGGKREETQDEKGKGKKKGWEVEMRRGATKSEELSEQGKESGVALTCELREFLSPEEAARFDAFVNSAPYTSATQRSSWIELSPKLPGGKFAFLICRRGEEILVAGLCRMVTLLPGRYAARFNRGPIFNQIEAFDLALPSILKRLRQAGVCAAFMNPRWEDEEAEKVEEVMRAHGMKKVSASEEIGHTATGIVSLEGSEEEIFAGFEDRCRRDIKRGVKKGIVVREACSEQEARAAQGIRKELARARGMDDIGQPDLVDLWRVFKERGEGVLLVAEAEGKILGGLAVSKDGDRAIIRGGGTVPVLKKIPRTHNLIWESMRIMKSRGCRRYDLAGMAVGEAADEGERRRQFFKRAFNPRIVRLVSTHVAVLNAFEHLTLYRLRRAISRSPLRKAVAAVLRR